MDVNPVIQLEGIEKVYQTGEVAVKAVRGVSLMWLRANSWR